MAEPQQYSLRWSNYFRQLTYALDTHRFNDEFVDVSLLCDGRKIKAHKVILSACSSYFKEILTENPHPHPLIIFKFIKFEDLNSIIKFMYQGEVNVEQDALQSFLQTAELLAVHGLNAEEKDKSQEPSAVLSEHDIIKSIPRTSTVRAVNVASLTTQNADIPFIQVKQNLASTSNTHQIATHQDNTTGGNTQQHHQVHTQNQEYPTTTLTVNKATPPVPSCSKGSKKRRVTFSGDGENSFYTIAHLGEQTLGKSDGMTFKESISMDIPEYVLGEVGNTLSDTGGTDENNQAAVSVAQNVSQYKSEYEILMESEIEEKYQPVDNSEIIIENRRLINQSFSDVQCPVKDTNLASNIGLTGNKDNSTGVLNGPDIRKLLKDANFTKILDETSLNAWDSIRAVIENVLCKNRSPYYRVYVDNMMQSFDAFGVKMSLKIHMLHAHFDFYERQMSTETDETDERFYQTIMTFEDRFAGKRIDSMLSDFCWSTANEK